jgi:hypothetical protein
VQSVRDLWWYRGRTATAHHETKVELDTGPFGVEILPRMLDGGRVCYETWVQNLFLGEGTHCMV